MQAKYASIEFKNIYTNIFLKIWVISKIESGSLGSAQNMFENFMKDIKKLPFGDSHPAIFLFCVVDMDSY